MEVRANGTRIGKNEFFQAGPFAAKQSMEKRTVHVNLQEFNLIPKFSDKARGSVDISQEFIGLGGDLRRFDENQERSLLTTLNLGVQSVNILSVDVNIRPYSATVE